MFIQGRLSVSYTQVQVHVSRILRYTKNLPRVTEPVELFTSLLRSHLTDRPKACPVIGGVSGILNHESGHESRLKKVKES